MVVLEWKERKYFDIHAAITGDFLAVPHDADSFFGEWGGIWISHLQFLVWISHGEKYCKCCERRNLGS
jgi:hypothetical protein